jgi:predicted nucleic acid-binding protein
VILLDTNVVIDAQNETSPFFKRSRDLVLEAVAYRQYLLSRRKSAGGKAPSTPLPDFFIGAHAEMMGWKLATRDSERFRLYFPIVQLIEPPQLAKR